MLLSQFVFFKLKFKVLSLSLTFMKLFYFFPQLNGISHVKDLVPFILRKIAKIAIFQSFARNKFRHPWHILTKFCKDPIVKNVRKRLFNASFICKWLRVATFKYIISNLYFFNYQYIIKLQNICLKSQYIFFLLAILQVHCINIRIGFSVI